MRIFQQATIKKKLIFITMITTATALFLAGAVLVISEILSFRHTLLTELEVQARIIGNNSTAALLFGNQKDAEEILSGLRASRNIVGAAIYKPDGQVFAKYRASEGSQWTPPKLSKPGHAFYLNRLVLFQPIVLNGESVEIICLESNLNELYGRIGMSAGILGAAFAGALVISFLLISVLQKSITAPILELVTITGTVSTSNDYSVRAKVETNDELGALSRGFNEMMEQIWMRDSQLEKYRKQLEQKVTARTAELAEANRHLKEELLERQRAERLLAENNEELKGLVWILAHDLKEPMVNIQGFAGELTEFLKELDCLIIQNINSIESDEKKKIADILEFGLPETLDFINSSAQRMDSLIKAIGRLSQLGRQNINPELIRMNTLIDPMVNSLKTRLGESGKVLVRKLPSVIADKGFMSQIFSHILDNAFKYLVPERPGEIEIYGEENEKEVTFHIKDNGRGIAESDMHKVFDFFRRAGRDDVPGEGMGLAYARSLVRKHGGRIWCRSKLDQGTTISISIPNRLPEDQVVNESETSMQLESNSL